MSVSTPNESVGTLCRVALARGSCARVVHAPRHSRHMTLNLVTSRIALCLPSPPNAARVLRSSKNLNARGSPPSESTTVTSSHPQPGLSVWPRQAQALCQPPRRRPGILAAAQTALKLSFNRRDQISPGLCVSSVYFQGHRAKPLGTDIIKKKLLLTVQRERSRRRCSERIGACISVLVFACVCVCVCVCRLSICVRENLYLHFLNFVCACACNREGTSHASSRVDGKLE
jgi:hypothetical protein